VRTIYSKDGVSRLSVGCAGSGCKGHLWYRQNIEEKGVMKVAPVTGSGDPAPMKARHRRALHRLVSRRYSLSDSVNTL
jgi:hypothetical protein